MLNKLERITHQDLQILQTALIDLYADVSQSTLQERTLRFGEKIISADIVSYDLWQSNSPVLSKRWGNAAVQPNEEQVKSFTKYVHENPVFIEAVVKRRLDPIMLSDFMAVEDFVKTNVYKEFYSFVEAKYLLAVTLWVSSDLMMTAIFCNSQRNFTERDRQMLSSAAPHLINAVRNASDFDHLASALEIKNSGVLTISDDGKIQYASEFVRQIWGKYFDDNLKENALMPKSLRDWMKKNESIQNDFFEMKNSNGELNVRFITTDQTLRKTLLFEEKRTISAKTLEKLNLTKREAEILFWMAQGKTDKDIAKLCKISPLTVHKHAQNIYIKLGVETRTAAMLRAIDVL